MLLRCRCFVFVVSILCYCHGTYATDFEINHEAPNDTSYKYYNTGIDMGIIDPKKYNFHSFVRDEQIIFKDSYRVYNSFNYSQPINYGEWLIMNNFGILADTQRSLFERKIAKRSVADKKRIFVRTVQKGDVLISAGGRGVAALVGHAALMIDDNYVLEMEGGSNWINGIKDNNRRVNKYSWFDDHDQDVNKVYRCPDTRVAKNAANWANKVFFNPYRGGHAKRKHIRYEITPDVYVVDPNYCSKMVVQAFYYGNPKKDVIDKKSMDMVRIIPPALLPEYFSQKYKLIHVGTF